MSKPIESFCCKLGYRFTRIELLEQALTHRSASSHHNERLEYLGDSILGFVIAAAIFKRFPAASEGQMSRLRALLVKGKTLAEIAHEFGFSDVLRLGSGELKSGGHNRASILADSFEALIGAIYLDSDFSTIENLLLNWYQERLQKISLDDSLKDAKTRLQELLQANKLALPKYEILATEGKEHKQRFHVSCNINDGEIVTQASDTSKRKAEQLAAELALKELSGSDKIRVGIHD